MSGYAICYGPCVNCKRIFGFNPLRVPSIRVNGVKEPVCRKCIEAANPVRAAKGLPPLEFHPDAYEPCPEEALP